MMNQTMKFATLSKIDDNDNPQKLFTRAKAMLQKADDNGDSLYDLIAEMIPFLKPPANAVAHYCDAEGSINIEKLVAHIYQDMFRPSTQLATETTAPKLTAPYFKHVIRSKEVQSLFERAKKRVLTENKQEAEWKKKMEEEKAKKKPDDEQEEKTPVQLYFPGQTDIVDDVATFARCGVGLMQEEAYRIALSVKQLQRDKNLKFVRFFGKIFGTQKNYYICESVHVPQTDASAYVPTKFFIPATLSKKPEKPPVQIDLENLPPEEATVGANKFSYWVCNQLEETWTLLPNVVPAHILIARQLNNLFTGNLNHSFKSYPVFPGKEGLILFV